MNKNKLKLLLSIILAVVYVICIITAFLVGVKGYVAIAIAEQLISTAVVILGFLIISKL